jgi:predicted aspartyl protease
VNGTRQVALILDTGASYTILSPRLFSQLGLSVPAAAPLVQFVIAGGQRVQAPLVSVDSLEIGHARVAPLEVLAYDAIPEDPNLDGLIGLNFLNHFAVNIDRGAGVLTLAPKSSER